MKTATTHVYGYSDDLLEIEGDLFYDEVCLAGDSVQLAFSNGLLVEFIYCESATWQFHILSNPNNIPFTKMELGEAEEQGYSEHLIIEGHIEWCVVVGEEISKKEAN